VDIRYWTGCSHLREIDQNELRQIRQFENVLAGIGGRKPLKMMGVLHLLEEVNCI
jgi:hypothetical protein